jgi:hypothetical protein
MAGQAKVGSIAAIVTAVGYVLSVGALVVGTAMEKGDDSNDLPIIVGTWWIGSTVGTIAAAVVVYAALRRSGGFAGALPKAAIVAAVLAAVVSVMPWAFFVWGLLLSVAMLLLALRLRSTGLGVAGRPSAWDWVVPVAFPLGVATTFGFYATVVEASDNLDWAYTAGFSISLLMTAAAMIQAARWLRAPVEAATVASTT